MAAAVGYSSGTERVLSFQGEAELIAWTSPATMDSADTVVVPTRTDKTLRIVNAFDQSTGDSITATISTFTVTLDAAGSATDSEYTIVYYYE